MSKVLNFDNFLREKKRETIKVTIFGEEYEVPGEVPAIIPVMMARAEEEDGEDGEADGNNSPSVTSIVMKAADLLLGKDNVTKLCNKGLSTNDLGELVKMLFKTINGKDDEDDSEEMSDEDSRVAAPEGKNEKK